MIISRSPKAKVFHQEDCPYVNKISKKNRKHLKIEEARKHGYCDCFFCGGLHGIYLKTQKYPDMFGEKERKYISFYYDWKNQALFMRTYMGLWKVIDDNAGEYLLYHLNSSMFDREASIAKLAARTFHRQGDVAPTQNLYNLVNYIYRHDKAKSRADGDYRKLPKKTKTQKRYYKQAKKKDRRKKLRSIDKIFKELENERRTEHG